jgi:hypothetical protein
MSMFELAAAYRILHEPVLEMFQDSPARFYIEQFARVCGARSCSPPVALRVARRYICNSVYLTKTSLTWSPALERPPYRSHCTQPDIRRPHTCVWLT